MAANPEILDFALGYSISMNDRNLRFFFGEISPLTTPDSVTVIPLSGGQPIGNWSLDIAVSDYGPASPRWKINTLGSTPIASFLVSFAITDFSSDSALPLLTGVDGFRVVCPVVSSAQADPNIFGVYVSPPVFPGTIVIVY
jgi:hypothetical protein